ncbi:hypothetical protein E9168_27570 [Klebsiella pneumoniae subsp. pneumoniae]|uniref:Uncharacterized protein n=1 Tax=Klebsiella pneumoniae TaxID=573 RepID=A0A8E5QZZ3_KLEPN|nr:hypothetical protein [Klebsiella pneumoniae]QVI02515.1 hypothetical protein [Klebsiella pneumoniae]THI07656.1 hypothetical protein E9168_27570 [Klebsiella pneumoniae subsp. pneumoniae]
MINITFSMILFAWFDYHILCVFSATQIRKDAVPDLHALSGAPRPTDTRCATPSAAFSSICCVPPLPRDRPITPIKGRCGYSVCVVHFRKLWNNIKVGSGQSGRQVI